MDWKARAIDLVRNHGKGYTEASQIIYDEFGILVSDDTIRYHAVRKLNKSTARKKASKGKTKVLVLSDLHIPFHRESEIIDIILKHRHEISAIIFAGDSVDCMPVSKFPKETRKALIDEMVIAWEFFRKIDLLTPDVEKHLFWGNHEYRFVRYLADMQSELNALHSNNILREIVRGFTHHDRDTGTEVQYPPLSDNFKIINKWFFQYGDAIFAHPKNFSKVPLRTAIMTLDHFISRRFDFNALFIGHTHKWGGLTKQWKWVGELGCQCMPMDYADSGNVNYTPQEYGYLLLTQYDGITDINESRLYKLDYEGGDTDGEETCQT